MRFNSCVSNVGRLIRVDFICEAGPDSKFEMTIVQSDWLKIEKSQIGKMYILIE